MQRCKTVLASVAGAFRLQISTAVAYTLTPRLDMQPFCTRDGPVGALLLTDSGRWLAVPEHAVGPLGRAQSLTALLCRTRET